MAGKHRTMIQKGQAVQSGRTAFDYESKVLVQQADRSEHYQTTLIGEDYVSQIAA